MIIAAKKNQSIFDVLNQHEGTTIGIIDFLKVNNLNSLNLPVGNYEVSQPKQKRVAEFFKVNQIVPATGYSDDQLQLIGEFSNEFTNEFL